MKTKQFNMRIDEITQKTLGMAAVLTGYSKASIVCIAIREYVNSRKGLRDKIEGVLTHPQNTGENTGNE